MATFFRHFLSYLLTLLICLFIIGCERNISPANSILIDALQMQVQLSHEVLNNIFDENNYGDVIVLSANILEEKIFKDKNKSILKLTGESEIRLSNKGKKIKAPFLIFLEQGDKKESWTLLRLNKKHSDVKLKWISYPLPIKD